MGKMFLGLAVVAAACAIAGPASAGTVKSSFVVAPDGRLAVGAPGNPHHPGQNHHGGHGGLWVNGGEWARYNNQSFASDSFNDWWHDRPDRAYPAWMRNNQDCSRQWFAGNALRC